MTIMKKTYIIPSLTVVRVNTQQMLAASPVLGSDYTGGEVLAPEFEEFIEDFNSQSL
jgi:hypothetical protein